MCKLVCVDLKPDGHGWCHFLVIFMVIAISIVLNLTFKCDNTD